LRALIALTYYRPHVSGLTIYAERLARGLAGRGHEVTVLTSRFDPALPSEEERDGVRVVRVPILRKISKGVLMPGFASRARAAVREHDVVNVHMPQLEAALLTELGRAHRRPVVLTYQCDLQLPPGALNRVVERCLRPLNQHAAHRSDAIVTTSDDYAERSELLSRFPSKLRTIPPLIAAPPVDPQRTRSLVEQWQLGEGPVIGFAARFAAEKGVEVLLAALPSLIDEFPDLRVAFTGAYRDTIGEDAYGARLRPEIERHSDRLVFLDLLPDDAMPSFFAACDVLAVTSLNSTEAYGLVQPEAMLAGTPVVATDIPGVRIPVRETGMGLVVAAGDPVALAGALAEVLRDRAKFVQPAEKIRAHFDPEHSLDLYERLFEEVRRK